MKVRFGGCLYDAGARQLLRDGHLVALSPKAFDLLGTLLGRRPNAVGRAELHDRLWPGTFVGPTSLARLVSEVRRATTGHAGQPGVLRTVTRYGYAFVADAVEEPARPVDGRSLTAFALRWGSRDVPLAEGESLIGRGPECAVRFASPGISRRHARIVVAGALAVLEDLGSKNGTFLGGRAVEGQVTLRDGDEIFVGSEVLLFCASGPDGTTRTEGLRR